MPAIVTPRTPAFAGEPPRPPPASAPRPPRPAWAPGTGEGGPPTTGAGSGSPPVVVAGRTPSCPIAAAVVGVSGCAPAGAPFAWRMNAVTARCLLALRLSPVGGIVD